MHPYRVAALEPRSFPPGPQPGPFRISKANEYAPRVRGPISRLRASVAAADGIPPTPSSPAVPPSAVATETDMDTRSRPGQALPGRDRSGLWLRNAAVGLCALAAAAAVVSFTASGGLRYHNCLNACPGAGVQPPRSPSLPRRACKRARWLPRPSGGRILHPKGSTWLHAWSDGAA